MTEKEIGPRVRQSVAHVPIDMLLDNSQNVRTSITHVEEMAASIREHGILQPLTVTEDPDNPGKLLLLAGHRRLQGARAAGLNTVPVIIRHGVCQLHEQILVMLVENTQRRDLEPMERAEAYGTLRNQGLSIAAISRRSGIASATISNYLSLLLLSPEDQELVRIGKLAPFTAIAAARRRRQAERKLAGEPRLGRPPTKKPKDRFWFGERHPLAALVRKHCVHADLSGPSWQVEFGCGPCWEEVIRKDAMDGGRGDPD